MNLLLSIELLCPMCRNSTKAIVFEAPPPFHATCLSDTSVISHLYWGEYCVLGPCSVRGASKVNVFVQMFQISLRLRKLERVLNSGEIEEGHFLPKTKRVNCRYHSMLNWWWALCVRLDLFGGIYVCVLVSRDKHFCCVAELLFQIGILNSALWWDLNNK